MQNPSSPLSQEGRMMIIDAIRGVALCGILILNISIFGLPESSLFNLDIYQETSRPDVWTWYITNFLVEGSFRGLFSMLFGAGMILLVSRLEKEHGIGAADIYYRRLIWLLIFGLINAFILLWPGDILYSYAVCGLFIFPFRKSSVRLLLLLCIFLIAITVFKSKLGLYERLSMRDKGVATLAKKEAAKDSLTDVEKGDLKKWQDYLDGQKVENQRKESDQQKEKVQGSYSTVWAYLSEISKKVETIWFYDQIFFDTLIFVFFGMAMYRAGILLGERPTWVYVAFVVLGYSIGLGSGFMLGHAWRLAGYSFFEYFKIKPFPFDVYQLHRVCVTLGHLGLLILLWKSKMFNWLLGILANVGQMAFTNYLMQSVICTLFFYGYGLGYYGKLHRYELWYVVVGVWIFQIIFSAIWLRYFRFGPLEWLWRSLTYVKRQPLIK